MTCLGSYEMFYFFSPYVLLLPVAYEIPPPQKFCVVYLNFTDYQMKHKTVI